MDRRTDRRFTWASDQLWPSNKELDTRLQRSQRQSHFRAFCRVPVNDLLDYVADKLPDVARHRGVDVIGWYPDFTAEKVESIDITKELAALFNS